ncbi:gluconokinase [Paenibacillus swuensis]|uniref:Gluconokinase n=1 Tax=Paenibacillus swuensis TaxID=1178515 RepID=A0A172TK63_9BACL|nr:gluconokinase [Paenibacillus swuensis]ANE47428.1 gluconokinase [Paenibacillus swuensis]
MSTLSLGTVSPEARYIVTVDIGTTSTKTLAVRHDGFITASHSVGYPLHTPQPDYAEQDPEEIWGAVLHGVAEVVRTAQIMPHQVTGVSFSSAMHSIFAVDREGRPLMPMMTWADNRSSAYKTILMEQYDGKRIYEQTGTPIHPMSPLLKLMWLQDHEPELFQAAYKFIGIKEYVFAKMFGSYLIDYSIASTTGLFHLRDLQWNADSLQAAGISAEQLSEPVPTTHIVTGLKPEYASAMGISPATPFILGAADGVLANLGSGCYEPGVYSVTIGTSGAVRGVVAEPIADARARLFCYALLPGMWVVGGAINNGGIMFRWARDQLATLEAEQARLAGEDPYKRLTELAASVSPGSEGLIFLPFLAGERAPHYNADARGAFFGLSLRHGKPHMVRAVLEGVIYRMASVINALEETGGPARELRASGGFARSAFWCQLLADVSGVQVTVPDTVESSGVGAARLALAALGKTVSVAESEHWIRTTERYEPNAKAHEVYKELFEIYENVYWQLQQPFAAISAFQKRQD